MSRDDFARLTVETLAKRVGVRCSNPACRKQTAGPRTSASEAVNIGVGAHITAAAPGGPRFDGRLSSTQRQSIENAIWLCQNCAKLIDNDTGRYTVDILKQWKHRAETAALAAIQGESQGGLESFCPDSNGDGGKELACAFCVGTGSDPFATTPCSICKGNGVLTVSNVDRKQCRYCKGTGRDPYEQAVCKVCDGLGLILRGEPPLGSVRR